MLSCSTALPVAAQVMLGQTDTFSSNTQSWLGASPSWISTGGPLGTGDGFLQLHSVGGIGAGSKMACFNAVQWSGNFNPVGSITVDFENLGSTELDMRLVFFASDSTQWDSNAITVLPAVLGWRHATFTIDPKRFTRVAGSASFASTISAANRMMFRHDPDPASSTGVSIVGTLGIDNVHAERGPHYTPDPTLPPLTPGSQPEPATIAALGLGLFAIRRRRPSSAGFPTRKH